MTSRLTLSAVVFALLSTTAMVWSAQAAVPAASATATRFVQLERVLVTAPRIAADA